VAHRLRNPGGVNYLNWLGLTGNKKPTGKTFYDICRAHICIQESRKNRKSNDEKGGYKQEKAGIVNRQ